MNNKKSGSTALKELERRAEKSLDIEIKEADLANKLMQITVMKVGIWASAGAFVKFIIEFSHKLLTGGN